MPRPALRVRIVPRFPARIQGADGIDVTRFNRILTVRQDWSDIQQEALPSDPENYEILLRGDADGDLVRVPADSIVNVPTEWDDIPDKPATFPPSAHTHAISEVTDLQDELDGKAATVHAHTVEQVAGAALRELPFNELAPNGRFDQWITRPSSGQATSPGAGVGFQPGVMPDGWYGGPGPSSQYTVSRDVDEDSLGTYALRLTWNASVAAGETQHDVAGQITAGYWRFTFLELIGRFAPGYIAGKTMTMSFDAIASGSMTIVPIAWISMGRPSWAASTAYYVGDVVKNSSGEFGYPRLYECVTAGTSAGSGGPTGTTTGITDGTAEWDYLGELKGREFELFEAGATATTQQIAWGDPHANAGCALTTSWQSFGKQIYIPDLTEGTGTRYSGQANDNGARFFAPPGGGGSYFGVGFDLYATGSIGPTIRLRRVRAYIGTEPAPDRPPRLPRDVEMLVANGWSRMMALYGQTAATKAQMEAGSSAQVQVTPAVAQSHPSAAKFWVSWSTSTTTLTANYNITSVTNLGVGDEVVTFNNDFANTAYVAVATANTSNSTDATQSRQVALGAKAAGSIAIYVTRGADPEVFADSTDCNVVGYGTLA